MTLDPSTPAKHDVVKPSLWRRFRASPLWDPATRAAHSAWQAAAAVWFVGGVIPGAGLGSVPWVAGVVAGGTASVASVALSVTTWKVPEQRTRVNDALRYVRTFAAALAGTWVASEATVLTFDWKGAALAAVLATVGSVVKTGIVNGNSVERQTLDQQRLLKIDPGAALRALQAHGVEPVSGDADD